MPPDTGASSVSRESGRRRVHVDGSVAAVRAVEMPVLFYLS